MAISSRYLIAIVVFFMAPAALSHKGGHHKHSHEPGSTCHGCAPRRTSADPQTDAIYRLLHVLHHAIEGEHMHIRSLSDFAKVFKDKDLSLG